MIAAPLWLLVVAITTPTTASVPTYGPYASEATCRAVGEAIRGALIETSRDLTVIPKCSALPASEPAAR